MVEIKQPKIRFKGHINDWKQCKLGNMVKRTKSHSLSRDVESKLNTGIRYIHYGDIHTKVADKITNKSKLPFIKHGKYEYLEKGDVILADASEDYKGIATPSVILEDMSDKIVAGLHTISLRPSNIDSVYLYYLLHSQDFKRYGYRVGTGMKVFGITFNNILNYENVFPEIDEQTRIGEFFKTLDDIITLHQQKLEVTKQFKQTMLKKMFPKNGETTPEIRFKGFTDDWEERSLESLYSKSGSGGTPKTNNIDYYNGDINFLNISDLSGSKGLILKTEKTITNEGLINSSAWIVPKGAISLAMYASVGKVAILGVESSTSQAFFNMVFDDDILRDLIYQILIKAYNFNEWDDLISYGTQPNLNSKKIKNFKTKIPKNKQEQLLIGDFLNNLDLNIYGLENKINEYISLKKTILKKMFI